ncbi:DUF1450 domain-containing protein [Alicyclobacillus sp.]|uniref:DUF1450 domain-containing protein n=1 Tax=Alicyclobacillus sp. TaxID=61169 RepID=UPI0025C34695|nr:DUF1450 domain-containing protein [Alicyclobacillus sp.]MCL6517498.1 YuzB family protein [Alicyclobacillus sp.]
MALEEARVRKVEICVSNLPLGTQRVWELIAERYPEVQLRRWACLGLCDLCVRRPFVLVDDREVLQAPSPEALWALFCRRMEDGPPV